MALYDNNDKFDIPRYNEGTPYETIKKNFNDHMEQFRIWLNDPAQFISKRTQEMYWSLVNTMLRKIDIRDPKTFFHLIKTEYSASTHNVRIASRRKYLAFMYMYDDNDKNKSLRGDDDKTPINRRKSYKIRQSLKRAIINFLVSHHAGEQYRYSLESICLEMEEQYRNMLENRAALETKKIQEGGVKIEAPKNVRDLEEVNDEELDALIKQISEKISSGNEQNG